MVRQLAAGSMDVYERTREAALEVNGIPVPKGLPPNRPPEYAPTAVLDQWGSAAMALAGLGSLLTRKPLTNALNAAGAAMRGFREGDTKNAEMAFRQWQQEVEYATRLHNFEMDAYRAAIDKIKTKPEMARAELTALTAAFKDNVALDMLSHGDTQGAVDLIIGRQRHSGRAGEAASHIVDFQALRQAKGKLRDAEASGDPVAIDAAKRGVADVEEAIRDRAFARNPYAADREDRAANKPVGTVTEQNNRVLAAGEFKKKFGRDYDPENPEDTLPFAEIFKRVSADTKVESTVGGHDRSEAQHTAVAAFERQYGRPPGEGDTEEMARLTNRARQNIKTPEHPSLTPDAVDFFARQYLRTGQYPPFGQAGRDDRVLIDNRAAAIAREDGHTVSDYLSGRAEMKADTSSLAQIVKISDAVIAFENTALENLKVVESLMDKGAGTSAGPVVNKWLQAGRRATGDPDVAAFNTAMGALAGEYGKIISGGSASIAATPEGAREEAKTWLDAAQSPEALKAQLEVAKRDMANRRNSLLEQREDITERMRRPNVATGRGTSASRLPTGASPVRPVANEDVPVLSSAQEYADLPSGSKFRKPDDPPGSYRTKP